MGPAASKGPHFIIFLLYFQFLLLFPDTPLQEERKCQHQGQKPPNQSRTIWFSCCPFGVRLTVRFVADAEQEQRSSRASGTILAAPLALHRWVLELQRPT